MTRHSRSEIERGVEALEAEDGDGEKLKLADLYGDADDGDPRGGVTADFVTFTEDGDGGEDADFIAFTEGDEAT